MPTIGLVDDDKDVLALVRDMLEAEGYNVMSYADPLRALRAFETNTPDLAILDINMPNINGVELLRRLRRKSDVPAIFLTGRLEEADEIRGLRVGADAYIRKPFSERTLIERVKAVLRRAGRTYAALDRDRKGIMDRGDLRIDRERYTCSWKGQSIVLTLTEFRLLEALAVRMGVVQPRDALKLIAYGEQAEVDDRTVDSHMKRLRKKFRAVDPGFDKIETLYGVGYRFAE
jgi:two-component system, OmpR family, response regulator ChvI